MVMNMNATPSQLDLTFAALSDPTRRAILARLAQGEATVNDLVEPFEMSQPAISKHIKVLEAAGLVTRGKDAQRRPVRIEAAPMAAAVGWLEEFRKFWETSYGRLDGLLAELQSISTKTDKKN
jgi:DNA-binding transcriptional ArsR family regulator